MGKNGFEKRGVLFRRPLVQAKKRGKVQAFLEGMLLKKKKGGIQPGVTEKRGPSSAGGREKKRGLPSEGSQMGKKLIRCKFRKF